MFEATIKDGITSEKKQSEVSERNYIPTHQEGQSLSKENALSISGSVCLGLSAEYIDAARQVTGTDISDTFVTLNSSKPAQAGGLSCTQGSYVDLGFGRLDDIHHEAIHVAQQKKGQAPVTMHFKGLPGNSDPVLEADADLKGSRLKKLVEGRPFFSAKPRSTPLYPIHQPIQRFVPRAGDEGEKTQLETIKYFDAKRFISYQEQFQYQVKWNPDRYKEKVTTVGFEHEFAQTKRKKTNEEKQIDQNILNSNMYQPGEKNSLESDWIDSDLFTGISHLELTKSTSPRMVFTDLPFILETDASNAIELVTPPFLLQTKDGEPLPDKNLNDKVREIFEKGLVDLVKQVRDMKGLISGFHNIFGIKFKPLTVPNIKPYHISYRTKGSTLQDFFKAEMFGDDIPDLPGFTDPDTTVDDVENIPVSLSSKNGQSLVGSQSNVATDLTNASLMEYSPVFSEHEHFFHTVLHKKLVNRLIPLLDEQSVDRNMVFFINELVRVILSTMAVWPLRRLTRAQEDVTQVGAIYQHNIVPMLFASVQTSQVKDLTGVWVKDSIINIGLGVLSTGQWHAVKQLLFSSMFHQSFTDILTDKDAWKQYIVVLESFLDDDDGDIFMQAFRKNMGVALDTLKEMVATVSVKKSQGEAVPFQPPPNVGQYGHDEKNYLRARQDTLLDAKKVNNAQMRIIWPGRMLHVVETRREGGKIFDLAREKREKYESQSKNGFKPQILKRINNESNAEVSLNAYDDNVLKYWSVKIDHMGLAARKNLEVSENTDEDVKGLHWLELLSDETINIFLYMHERDDIYSMMLSDLVWPAEDTPEKEYLRGLCKPDSRNGPIRVGMDKPKLIALMRNIPIKLNSRLLKCLMRANEERINEEHKKMNARDIETESSDDSSTENLTF